MGWTLRCIGRIPLQPVLQAEADAGRFGTDSVRATV
jgi:hypothetical protein